MNTDPKISLVFLLYTPIFIKLLENKFLKVLMIHLLNYNRFSSTLLNFSGMNHKEGRARNKERVNHEKGILSKTVTFWDKFSEPLNIMHAVSKYPCF